MKAKPFEFHTGKKTIIIESDRQKLIRSLKGTQLVVIDGFPGTGKSTISSFLSDELNLSVIELDQFRTKGTESFFLTSDDLRTIGEIINLLIKNKRKIIIEGVLAHHLIGPLNIKPDKYVWMAEWDNDNNKFQFVFEEYKGMSVEDLGKQDKEIVDYLYKNELLEKADIFYRHKTLPEEHYE